MANTKPWLVRLTTKDTFVDEILVIRSFYNLVSTAENRMVVSDKSRT
jgi:hypothetical protein